MNIFAGWIQRNFLAVLFAFAAVLLGLIVVEQNRTIVSQRILIRSLFADSVELSESKVRDLHKQREPRSR